MHAGVDEHAEAMLAHALVRSVRIQVALVNEVPLDELRPLASLHMARAYARELVDVLGSAGREAWVKVLARVGAHLVPFARERKPSRSRKRIGLKLGATGA